LNISFKIQGRRRLLFFANSAHNLERVLIKTPVKHVIVTGIGDKLGFPKAQLVNFVLKYVKKMVPNWHIPEAIYFLDALAKGDAKKVQLPSLGHDDVAFLQYTGGTTGVSKGAVLTHGNIIANVLQAKGVD
jgi:long-chain acyl-CoA synthetase